MKLEDIVIGIRTAFNNAGIEKAKKSIQQLPKNMKITGVSGSVNQASQAYNNLGNSVRNLITKNAATSSSILRVAQSARAATQSFKGLRHALAQVDRNQPPFAGWALSLMFFGMQVQRVMTRIGKSSLQTFDRVMNSVDGTVTNFDRLNGSMEYLKFVTGQALDPLLARLVPIIDRISEWVIENPKLVATLVSVVAVIGSLAFVIGTTRLAFSGIIPLFQKIGVLITSLSSKGGLAAILGGLSGPVILGIIAAVALLAAAFYTDFGGIRDFVTKTFGGMWETTKEIFGYLKEYVIGIWEFLVAFFEGDSEGMVDALKKIWGSIYGVFKSGVKLLGLVLINLGVLVVNLLKDLVMKGVTALIELALDLMLSHIQWWVKQVEKLLNFAGIETPGWITGIIDGLETAKDAVGDLQDKSVKAADKLQMEYISKEDLDKAGQPKESGNKNLLSTKAPNKVINDNKTVNINIQNQSSVDPREIERQIRRYSTSG